MRPDTRAPSLLREWHDPALRPSVSTHTRSSAGQRPCRVLVNRTLYISALSPPPRQVSAREGDLSGAHCCPPLFWGAGPCRHMGAGGRPRCSPPEFHKLPGLREGGGQEAELQGRGGEPRSSEPPLPQPGRGSPGLYRAAQRLLAPGTRWASGTALGQAGGDRTLCVVASCRGGEGGEVSHASGNGNGPLHHPAWRVGTGEGQRAHGGWGHVLAGVPSVDKGAW